MRQKSSSRPNHGLAIENRVIRILTVARTCCASGMDMWRRSRYHMGGVDACLHQSDAVEDRYFAVEPLSTNNNWVVIRHRSNE